MPSAADIANLTRSAASNAGALEQANQQTAAGSPGQESSAFDVWKHTGTGLQRQMTDPTLQGDPGQAFVEGLGRPRGDTGAQAITASLSQQSSDFAHQVGLITGLSKPNPGEVAPQGALATFGATMGALTSLEQMISTPLAAIPFPAFPAVRITDMDVGLPHAHSHPPNLIPPAPPVPLPSTGPVIPIPFLSGAVRTLINGLPAARCGDMGLGIWCGGYFPMYEIFLGSSSVWIEGARAARVGVDITKHCIFSTPKPSDPPLGPMIGMTVSCSPNTLIGGVPMPSLLNMAMGAAIKGLMKGLGKAVKALQKTRAGQAFSRFAHKSADDLMNRLGINAASKLRNRFHASLCRLTGHPVDVATGKVLTHAVDFSIPGLVPFELRRVWFSTSGYAGPLGRGWHTSFDSAICCSPDGAVVRLSDGRLAVFPRQADGGFAYDRLNRLALRANTDDTLTLATLAGERFVYARTAGATDEYTLARIEDRNDNSVAIRRQGVRITQFVDSAGREYPVELDAAGRIKAVLGPHPTESGEQIALVHYEYNERGELVAARNALGFGPRYEYENGLLVAETDAAGSCFRFRYDRADTDARCVQTWGDDNAFYREISYDNAARQTRVVDSLGAMTTFHMNADGLVEREVDSAGAEKLTEWDAWGTKLSETDACGGTTRYEHDAFGRVVAVTDPTGGRQAVNYDALGRPVALTDATGATWTRLLDAAGNCLETTNPEGHRFAFSYDTRGRLTSQRDPLGRVTALRWDERDNLRGVTYPDGHLVTLEYDRLGRLRARREGTGESVVLERDMLGRITRHIDAAGRSYRYGYATFDNPTTVLPPTGHARYYEFGLMGRIQREINAAGGVTEYLYDRESRLIGVNLPGGRSHRLTRDQRGHIVAERDFAGRRTSYQNDALGRPVSIRTARGEHIRIVRDAAGRVVGRNARDVVEQFEFDAARRLIKATRNDVSTEFTYDLCGRILAEISDQAAVTHGYNPGGERIRRTSPLGHTIEYEHDPRGGIATVRLGDELAVTITRDAFGYPTLKRSTWGAEVRREYADHGRLRVQEMTSRRQVEARLEYRYDAGGRIEEIADSRFGTTRVLRDAVGRLTSARSSAGHRDFYEYDASGNVPATPRLEESANEVSLAAEGWRLRFDADGNLVSKSRDGERFEFSYDTTGRLQCVTLPDRREIRYRYDGLGRRITRTLDNSLTRYCWDGSQLIGQTECPIDAPDHPRAAQEYVHDSNGLDLLAVLDGPDALLVETSANATPRIAVGRDGIAWEGDIDLFGRSRQDVGGRISQRCAGQIWDHDARLSYSVFRDYDPALRAFTTSDPLGLAGGHRLYNYSVDPLTLIDPWGLNPEDIALGLSTYKVPLPDGRQATATGVLSRFAADPVGDGSVKPATWTSFDPAVNPNTGLEDFGAKIENAMRDADRIHFNLEGMNNVDDILKNSNPGRFSPPSTNWELATVLNDPELRAKTTFYDGPGKLSSRIPCV